MLPLHGVASQLRGFGGAEHSRVIRLRSPECTPSDEADVALIRRSEDIETVLNSEFTRAVLIGELHGSNVLPELMVLPSRFDYLGDGDILGVRVSSRHF